MPTGLFIVLEGIDGSGTTTQARLLTEWLESHARQVVPTREPTGGPVGALIRLALGKKHGMGRRRDKVRRREMKPLLFGESIMAAFDAQGALSDERTLALLFAADRSDHLNTTILPAIRDGLIVVSDRYYLSSVAYQSSDMPIEWVESLNEHFQRADLTILLDVSPEECLRRVKSRGTGVERYEYKTHLEKIRGNYRLACERAVARRERIQVVDGEQSIEAVQGAVRDLVVPLINAQPPADSGPAGD